MKYRCLRGNHGLFVKNDEGVLEAKDVGPGDVVDLEPDAIASKVDAFGAQFVPAAGPAPSLGIDLAGTVPQIAAYLSVTDDVAAIEAIVEAEKDGENRKGVLKAAEKQLARLAESEDDDEDSE